MNALSPALYEWIQAFEGHRCCVPGLMAVDGRLLLAIDGHPVAMLRLVDGVAELSRDVVTIPASDAMADFVDAETLIAVLSGELHAVVAALQGRLYTSGNLFLSTKVLLGMRADKPFAMPDVTKEEGHAD